MYGKKAIEAATAGRAFPMPFPSRSRSGKNFKKHLTSTIESVNMPTVKSVEEVQ